MEPLRAGEIVTVSLRHQLISSGMSEGETAAKLPLFSAARDALGEFAGPSSRLATAFFVPGRLEVLGKHTDYAGGRSLLATVEKGFCVVAQPRADSRVCVFDARSREKITLMLSGDPGPVLQPWTNYVRTVVHRLAVNMPHARTGVDIVFASDLPPAAGLSSSSALMIAVYLALANANSLHQMREYIENIHSPEDLAGYIASIEAGQDFRALSGGQGVGTFGGSEDHTAILCCSPRHLSQYSFCPVRSEGKIALPPDVIFAIADSGVAAEKTGAALHLYNNISAAARAILSLWREETGRSDPSLAAAATSSPDAPEQIRGLVARSNCEDFAVRTLLGRFDQFIEESEVIVPNAADAFRRADWSALGSLVDRSQRDAGEFLGNQVPQTIALARIAREGEALAASSFGAGFGGSIWALVPTATAKRFLENWKARYQSQFPEAASRASFFLTRPGPAAFRLRLDV
jgi:galactokinase